MYNPFTVNILQAKYQISKKTAVFEGERVSFSSGRTKKGLTFVPAEVAGGNLGHGQVNLEECLHQHIPERCI